MNENDVREMFQRREGDVHAPASTPRQLVARTRRRERLSAGVGVAVAVVVVVVSIAGLRSLGSSDGSQPGDVGPTTTKTVSGITITYPERWFAEDPVALGIEPTVDGNRTLPTLVLTLTRDDPHIQGVLGCPRLANIPDQVLMTVQETPLAMSGEASAPWPVPLRSAELGSDQPGGCYEGWTFMRAAWTAAGRSFEARVGFASDASDADRSAMTDAYTSMTFAPGSVAVGDTVTLGSGTAFSDITWSLTATRDANGVSWTFETDNTGFGTGPIATSPDAPSLEVHDAGSEGAFAIVTLPNDVHSVVMDVGGNVIGDIGLFPVPPSWGELRFAVIPLPGSGTGTIRFHDLQGHDVYPPQSISWDAGAGSSSSPPMTAGASGDQLPWENIGGHITAMGTFAGIDWTAEPLFYRDGVRLTIDGAAEDLGILRLREPVVRPLDADGFDALLLVLTDTSVDRVSVGSEGTWDGRWMPASTGAGGEARLWVIELRGAGQGTLLFDGQGSGEVSWP